MLRLMREYPDMFNEKCTPTLTASKQKLTTVNKNVPSTMNTLSSITTPIEMWKDEIRKFGNTQMFTERFYPSYFSRFEYVYSREDIVRHKNLGGSAHNNFHLIHRQ